MGYIPLRGLFFGDHVYLPSSSVSSFPILSLVLSVGLVSDYFTFVEP